MLTREQVYTMLMLRKREDNIFSVLPNELICYISDVGQDPNSEIAEALCLAADGEEKALNELTVMLDKNPRLLLQAGNVVTRGGLVRRVTLYEFFLGAGDPDAAKQIEPYFAKIKDEDGKPVNGEHERERQYERYRPHIEALAQQLESKQPAYDLRPLIDIIKQSSAADVTAMLNKDMAHKSILRDALIQFREAVRPKKTAVGMHYKHYTTLIQAFNLLYYEWFYLKNGDNYDKCNLVFRQIIGYLQRDLPPIDRFAFARAFDDKERTLKFKYGRGSFPDTSSGDADLAGLGFDVAISGWSVAATWNRVRHYLEGLPEWPATPVHLRLGNFMSSKNFKLAELMRRRREEKSAGCVIC